MSRLLRYREALAEGLVQAMEADPAVFCFGVGVDDPKGIFGTTRAAFERFGSRRVFDTPLSENALTGIAVGAALNGFRPVLVHARVDFLLLTLDQLINNAAKWRYMSNGDCAVPLVVRAIVGRGWGQGPQHSQSLQAILAHIPGLKVTMPATPEDAKGLLIAAIQDNNPVVQIEHRRLYEDQAPVPPEPYTTPIGAAACRRYGDDVTIVAASAMVPEALTAADLLAQQHITAEVIDVRTVAPLDTQSIMESVNRTRHLVVADTGTAAFGLAAEVAALAAERAFLALKGPIRRVANPHVPTPSAWALEQLFYPDAAHIVQAAREALGEAPIAVPGAAPADQRPAFQGPF